MTAQELVTYNISEKIDILLYNQAKQDKKIDDMAAMQLRQDQMLTTCVQLLRAISFTMAPDEKMPEFLTLDSAKKQCDDLLETWLSGYLNEGLDIPNFPDRDTMGLVGLATILRNSLARETIPAAVVDLQNTPIYMRLNSRFAPNGVLQQSLDMDPCDKLLAFGKDWVEHMKDSDKYRKFPNVMLPNATNDKTLVHMLKEELAKIQASKIGKSREEKKESDKEKPKKDSKKKPKRSRPMETIEEEEEEQPDGQEESDDREPIVVDPVAVPVPEEAGDEVNAELDDDQGLDDQDDQDSAAESAVESTADSVESTSTLNISTPASTPGNRPASNLGSDPVLKEAVKKQAEKAEKAKRAVIPPRLSLSKNKHKDKSKSKDEPKEASKSKDKTSKSKDKPDNKSAESTVKTKDKKVKESKAHKSQEDYRHSRPSTSSGRDRRLHRDQHSESSEPRSRSRPIQDRREFDKAVDDAMEKVDKSTKSKKRPKPVIEPIQDRHEFDKAVDAAMEKSKAAHKKKSQDRRELDKAVGAAVERAKAAFKKKKRSRDEREEVSPAGKRQKIDDEVVRERHEKRVVRTDVVLQDVQPELRPHLMGRKAERLYGSPKPPANFPVAAGMNLDEILGNNMKEVAQNRDRSTPYGVKKVFSKDQDGGPTDGYYVDSSLEKSRNSSDGQDFLEDSTESPGRLVIVDNPNNNKAPIKNKPNMTITVSSTETIAVSSTESVLEVPTGGEQPDGDDSQEDGIDQDDGSQVSQEG